MNETPDLQQYDVVRVESLESATPYQTLGPRAPAIGDVGAIVLALSPSRFVVENVNADGSTGWVCDFDRVDLSFVSRPK